MISNLFILASVASIPSIIGSSLWASSNDLFTLVGIYDFHWFVSVTSFAFSVLGYVCHTFSFVYEMIQNTNLIHLHLFTVSAIGGVYTLFWFVCSINLSVILKQCIDVKRTYQVLLDDNNHFLVDKYNYQCNGEIVSMTFSYVNFLIWLIIFYKSLIIWMTRYYSDNAVFPMQNMEAPTVEQSQQPTITQQTINVEQTQPIIEQAPEISSETVVIEGTSTQVTFADPIETHFEEKN